MYLITYLLTPLSRVFLKKLTGTHVFTKFPAFYGTRKFITSFTTPPPVPIVSQINPVLTLTSQFVKNYFNIFLSSMPRSSKWSLSLKCLHQNPVSTSPLPVRAACPFHLIIVDLFTRITFGEQYISLSYSLCSFLHFRVISFLLGPNIFITLFSNTLSLPSSLNVSDQVSHPYKTSKIVVLVYFKFYTISKTC
jgi:hypothetical protein